MQYNKPPKNIKEQIKLLRDRNLIINDEEKLSKYLFNISYYHFSIYFKHFQKNDHFIEGTTFEDVLNIYVFDQKLRLLLADVLERVEKSFKCRVIYEMAIKHNDSHWIANEKYFDDKENYYRRTMEILDNLKNSKELCIKHYYKKYSSPEYPPTWTIIESLTFGQVVMIYGQLTKDNQKIIADSYNLDKKHIRSWMYSLSVIRNFCAHHSRLWNRKMIVSLNKKIGLYKDIFSNSQKNRLWDYLVVLQIINCKFNPDSKWIEKLKDLILSHKIDVSYMDFPENWQDLFDDIKNIELKNNN